MLIDKQGIIKLTDFGFARQFAAEDNKPMTLNVGTLCYRAPEVIFGSPYYGPAIDIWGIGCIIAELIMKNGTVLFFGTDEISQLKSIFKVLGTPDEENW